MPRTLAILEPLAVFACIVWYIWQLRAHHPYLWIAILAAMVLSHVLRRETPACLGFTTRDLRHHLGEFAAVLILLALAMIACGLLLHTMRPIDWRGALPAFAAYLPWGVLQQYILNGYFLNRFDKAINSRIANFVTAALFSAVHFPNWFLMIVTLAGGYCAVRVYRRHRNLYLLGLAHAIIGFLLYLVVPDSTSHHLRVGPGWFKS